MAATLIIRDVQIFDGEKVIPKGSVVVESGVIKSVHEGQHESPDASWTSISKPGHTLIPGIIDGHIHAHKGDKTALTQSIKFGVTTVCDMHNESKFLPGLRQQAAEDVDAADFKTACQAATIRGGWPEAVVTSFDKSEETKQILAQWPDIKTQEDIDLWIQQVTNDKADYVKLMHEDGAGLNVKPAVPSVDLQKAIVKTAHDHGFIALAHSLSLGATIDMLNAGIDGMTHTFVDKPPTEEVIDAYKRNNAHCNPTLATIGSLTGEGKEMQNVYAKDPRVTRHLSDDVLGRLCHCAHMSSEHATAEHAYQSVRELKAAGIDIIVGSDAAGALVGVAYGFSAHHEMALLVEKCGFSPLEALTAATSTVARRLRLTDRGRISEGLRADLVLVEGDPIKNIDDTLNIRGVWKKGELTTTYRDL